MIKKIIENKILKKVYEKLILSGENKIDGFVERKIENYKLNRFKSGLEEGLLSKYGDESFYDNLCNILLKNNNFERLIERCRQKDFFDEMTDEDFWEHIMQYDVMNAYNKANVKKALEHIEKAVFLFTNELKDPEHNTLKKYIIKDGEKTRDLLKKQNADLINLLENDKQEKCEVVNNVGFFITKNHKKEVKHFAGREKEIQDIIEIMRSARLDHDKTFLWIYGMGGLGKTQLCRKISSTIDKEYTYIGWIDYQGSFKQSLVNCLNVWEKSDDLDKEYDRALRYINSLGNQLLLFIDNYDTADSCLDDIESLPCHVVVTSRSKNPDTFSGYKLGFLDFSACKKLFCHFYTLENNIIINEIIHKTGYLSLAVELVAKTGQKLGLTLEEYYLKLEEKGFDIGTIVQSNWDNMGEKLNIELSKHFSIVFDLTTLRENEEAMYILKNFSLLPYLGITRQEAVNWLLLDEESGILYDLAETGWLQLSEMEYTMHPVISFTVKYMTSPLLRECVNLVTALSGCISVRPGDNYLDAFYYLPYAEAVGEYFVSNLLAGEKIEILLWLYIRIAEINRHNGDYDKAYRWGEDSCKCLDTLSDRSGKLTNMVYNVMSEICLDMRDRDCESRKWALYAIYADRFSEDTDSVEKGTSYHNLAGAYIQMGYNRKALKNERKALELRENLQKDDIRIINCYRNMAMIYRRLGDLELALKYHEYVLRGLEKIHADDRNHPDFPVVYNLYSFVLRDLGRLPEAIEYQEKAMAIREKINEADPKLAINYNNLGIFHWQNRNLEEAVRWERKAIEMDEKNRGYDHPDVATDYYNYALILYDIGNVEEAIKYLGRSRSIEEKAGRKRENIEQIDSLLVAYKERLKEISERK